VVKSLSSSGESGNWREAGRSPASLLPTREKVVTAVLCFGDEFTTLKDRKKEIGRDLHVPV
jgi:hypothetical protein